VYALGDTLAIDPTSQNSVDALTIDLESEVLALATDSGSTVVPATTLGLVVLDDVPRLWTRGTTPELPSGANLSSLRCHSVGRCGPVALSTY
jgi:hypothetical protein